MMNVRMSIGIRIVDRCVGVLRDYGVICCPGCLTRWLVGSGK